MSRRSKPRCHGCRDTEAVDRLAALREAVETYGGDLLSGDTTNGLSTERERLRIDGISRHSNG